MAHERKITETRDALFAKLLKEGNDPISFFCDVLATYRQPNLFPPAALRGQRKPGQAARATSSG